MSGISNNSIGTLECLRNRSSIRHYSEQPIPEECLFKILQSAVCAPSGKNGQPWRFKVINDTATMRALSQLSVINRWIRNAPCGIAVFLDKSKSYDYIKDVQSCGAAMENILLAATALNLGSCWVGEVTGYQDKVKQIMNISSDNLELMGIITVGYAAEMPCSKKQESLDAFLIK